MYIIKNNFFSAFKCIFYVILNLKNIQASFKTIGLVLYNPKKMINNLNFKFCMPMLSNFCLISFTFINPNMLCIAKNVVWNFINLKNKIIKHQSSFFIYLYELVDIQIKSIFKLMHKMVLLEIENKIFCMANELLNKWKKTKKTCVWIEWLFNVSKVSALQFLKSEICIEETNMSKNDNYMKEVILHVQCCGKCNQLEHNAWICELESVISKEKNDI